MLLFDPLVIALKCFHFGQLMSIFYVLFQARFWVCGLCAGYMFGFGHVRVN